MNPAPKLRMVFWETTRACNLSCRHCRALPKKKADPEDLTREEALKMLDEWPSLGNPVLVFSGGEPLMRPDLFELLARGKSLGVRMALATNGTLVTGRLAGRIKDAGLHRVSVSLDGPDGASHDGFRRSPGAFDATLRGLRLMRERGVPLQINTSVTTHNAGKIEEMLALACKEKVQAFHLFMLVPVGCGLTIPENQRLDAAKYEEMLRWFVQAQAAHPEIEMKATCAPHVTRVARQFLMESGGVPAARAGHPVSGHGLRHASAGPGKGPSTGSGHGCLAGSGVCFVSYQGEVQGCGYLPLKAGSLRVKPLKDIWETSILFQSLRDPLRLTGKCGSCDYKEACGGCRARAYAATGDVFSEETLCDYRADAVSGAGR